MDKYIVVTTYCDKKEIADKIINTLLEKKACCRSSYKYGKFKLLVE